MLLLQMISWAGVVYCPFKRSILSIQREYSYNIEETTILSRCLFSIRNWNIYLFFCHLSDNYQPSFSVFGMQIWFCGVIQSLLHSDIRVNVLLLFQEHLKQSDLSFVFRLQVSRLTFFFVIEHNIKLYMELFIDLIFYLHHYS